MGSVPLAGRLGLVEGIPRLLRVPGMRRLFGRSWEAVAVRVHDSLETDAAHCVDTGKPPR